MPTYQTQRPVTVTLNLGFVVANVRVTAGDRADTTVDVQPTDATSKADVKVAEQTRVEHTDDAVLVKAPKLTALFSRTGAIDVNVEVPAGSAVHGETGMGEFISDGRLGECRFKTGYGEIRVDRADAVVLVTASGDVTVGQVGGRADVSTSTGAVRIGRIDGPATVKNSNGTTWIGDVTGDLRVNGANGPISVDHAQANAIVKTANGSVRIGEVFHGAVALETASGGLEVGIHEGAAAWLDLHTVVGRVRNELDATAEPNGADQTVQVRARTYVGDIVIRRS